MYQNRQILKKHDSDAKLHQRVISIQQNSFFKNVQMQKQCKSYNEKLNIKFTLVIRCRNKMRVKSECFYYLVVLKNQKGKY